MFMYFLQPHWVPATWRSLAQTSIRAELYLFSYFIHRDMVFPCHFSQGSVCINMLSFHSISPLL